MKLNVLAFLLFLGLPNMGYTQSVVPIDTTIEHFVENMLIGSKQNVMNVQGNYDHSIGVFYDFDNSELGLDYGVILATGPVTIAVGPNDEGGAGIDLNIGGDSTLAPYSPGVLHDATSIEFDFTPVTNEISFDYVFASEEYPEYVNSMFNDVFGFFVSGPGIEGEQNIALLPDSSVVAINSVNHLTNSQWFKNNSLVGGSDPVDLEHIQYDGFTVPLVAKIEVTPFLTYHIKLVIADVADGVWDSAIFLKAKSFESVPLVFDFNFAEGAYYQTVFEDSNPLIITAKLPKPAKQDITYHFSYSGDAELGQDFIAPETFTFKQGDTIASFSIEPILDKTTEGVEQIIMLIEETQDTLIISIDEHAIVPISELVQSGIVLFPNPAHGSFGLAMDMDVEMVSLYTLAGKRVKEFRAGFQHMKVDDLAKGMYAVHVVTKEGLVVRSLQIE